MRTGLIIILLISGYLGFAQPTLTRLCTNQNFNWLEDSTVNGLTMYYQSGSWASEKSEMMRQRVARHLAATKQFIGIDSYDAQIHLFIVDSREQMKLLIGRETNGLAIHQYNILTGIASESINSIYSNHEFFHIMAMNLWGIPDLWLNEGMAVYADQSWHGHELHALTNYLVNNNRQVQLARLIKDFRKIDDRIAYPLAGSFVKYIDDTYGRATLLKIWKTKTGKLKELTGKTITELESDWLAKVSTIAYTGITY